MKCPLISDYDRIFGQFTVICEISRNSPESPSRLPEATQ
jgi:hypothetical protein